MTLKYAVFIDEQKIAQIVFTEISHLFDTKKSIFSILLIVWHQTEEVPKMILLQSKHSCPRGVQLKIFNETKIWQKCNYDDNGI